MSLTGFYLYNKTNEPCANYWEPGLNGANRFADPGDYILQRRVNVLALNNTWLPSNNTVVTLRYGCNRFIDNNTLSIDFDPATLGFSPTFPERDAGAEVPAGPASPTTTARTSRAWPARSIRSNINWHSWGANGALTKLLGRHTLKFGVDFRLIGLDFQSFARARGRLPLRPPLHVAGSDCQRRTAATRRATRSRSFLLGYPSGDPGNLSTRSALSTPLEMFTNYFGFYAQDDFRVNSKLTFNYGLRLEHEDGLRGEERPHHRGVRSHARPRRRRSATSSPSTASRCVGGLVYAGQNGANDLPGRSAGAQGLAAARRSSIRSTRRRCCARGYGIYWAPWNYQAPNNTNYGQIGFSQDTLHQPGPVLPDGRR